MDQSGRTCSDDAVHTEIGRHYMQRRVHGMPLLLTLPELLVGSVFCFQDSSVDWRLGLKPGDLVDVFCTVSARWFEGIIMGYGDSADNHDGLVANEVGAAWIATEPQLVVHFRAWRNTHDERIGRFSYRLQPPYSHYQDFRSHLESIVCVGEENGAEPEEGKEENNTSDAPSHAPTMSPNWLEGRYAVPPPTPAAAATAAAMAGGPHDRFPPALHIARDGVASIAAAAVASTAIIEAPTAHRAQESLPNTADPAFQIRSSASIFRSVDMLVDLVNEREWLGELPTDEEDRYWDAAIVLSRVQIGPKQPASLVFYLARWDAITDPIPEDSDVFTRLGTHTPTSDAEVESLRQAEHMSLEQVRHQIRGMLRCCPRGDPAVVGTRLEHARPFRIRSALYRDNLPDLTRVEKEIARLETRRRPMIAAHRLAPSSPTRRVPGIMSSTGLRAAHETEDEEELVEDDGVTLHPLGACNLS